MPHPVARNLRYICAQEGSVSQVCRSLGFNRQQFARYIQGKSLPSARNMIRICEYFQIDEDSLALPHNEFLMRLRASHPISPAVAPNSPFYVLPGSGRQLRSLIGTYHAHYLSPSRPGRIIKAMVQFAEHDGRFTSRTIERLRDPTTGKMLTARYEGIFSERDNNIFIIEWGRSTGDISETIISPLYRNLPNYLNGMTLGLSWRTKGPFATRTIWSRIPMKVSARDAISQCGSFRPDSRALDETIRRFFQDHETRTLHLLHQDD